MLVAAPRSSSLLLVEMPFKAVNRPSIGLSLLRTAAREAGFSCALRYANLPFAERIGFDLYETIAERTPPECLLGDLVFQPMAAVGRPRAESDVRRLVRGVPERPLALLPELRREAATFVDELARDLLDAGHRRIGLSAMFQVMPNLALAQALKSRDASCRIVMGGACCEGEMGLALHEEHPWIDFICRGEGERFIVDWLNHLETGRPAVAEIPGLVAREGHASVAVGESTRRIQDLESLPVPDYTDWAEQARPFERGLPRHDLWLPIEASRGCWWGQKNHCIFCGLNGENMAFRAKGEERVWQEIQACVELGIEKLYFVDLIFPPRFFETLLPRLAAEQRRLTIFYEVKANLTFSHLEALAAAGVRLLQPGIESLSTPVLRLMRKGTTAYQNLRLLKWAAELGVDLSWNLLYGFPGEGPEEYDRMAALVPLISHLQPPFSGCRRVRVDRFSPLFFDAERLGVGALRPSPAYEAVYDLPPERLARLAYFFEPLALARDDADYRPLIEAVDGWIEGLGGSSFTSLDRGGRLHLFDRRPGLEVGRRVLEGDEKAVYLACEEGAAIGAIARATSIPDGAVERILGGLAARGAVVALDGHFLALAVRMDRWMPPDVSDELLGPVCHAIHRARMLALRKEATGPDEEKTTASVDRPWIEDDRLFMPARTASAARSDPIRAGGVAVSEPRFERKPAGTH